MLGRAATRPGRSGHEERCSGSGPALVRGCVRPGATGAWGPGARGRRPQRSSACTRLGGPRVRGGGISARVVTDGAGPDLLVLGERAVQRNDLPPSPALSPVVGGDAAVPRGAPRTAIAVARRRRRCASQAPRGCLPQTRRRRAARRTRGSRRPGCPEHGGARTPREPTLEVRLSEGGSGAHCRGGGASR